MARQVWLSYLLKNWKFTLTVFALYFLCVRAVFISPNSKQTIIRLFFFLSGESVVCLLEIIGFDWWFFYLSDNFENSSDNKIFNFFILNKVDLFIDNLEFIMLENVNDDKLWVDFDERLNVRINFLEWEVFEYKINQNVIIWIFVQNLLVLFIFNSLP